jgi:hypothetical protein
MGSFLVLSLMAGRLVSGLISMRVECELSLMICKEGKDAFSETLMLFFIGCNAMTLGLS